jgi:hypothetical protein
MTEGAGAAGPTSPSPVPSTPPRSGFGTIVIAFLALLAGMFAVIWQVTRPLMDPTPVQLSEAVYTKMVAAASRDDAEAARAYCSTLLKDVDVADLAKLPTRFERSFKAWQEGETVLICPTDLGGTLYQFVNEGGAWKYDGPIGTMTAEGKVIRTREN